MLLNFQKIPFLKFATKQHFFFSSAKTAKTQRDYSKLSYYEILSVSPSSTQKEIKAKYYELAKKFHPDTYKGTDTEFFKHVQAAYETLKNPEKRKEYDMKNSTGFGPSETSTGESSSTGEAKKKGAFEDIEVDANMNFDEEYSKFFNKPRENDPDQMVVEEHPFLRQLNLEERMRYEYKFVQNNKDVHFLKYAHHEGYTATVNETIKLANRRVEMTDEVKERIHKAQEEDMNLKYTLLKAGIVVIFVPLFMMTFHRRMKAKEEMQHKFITMVKEQEELEIQQVQKRFVFENEK